MRGCISCGVGYEAGWTCPGCGFTPETRDGVVLLAPDQARDGRGFNPDDFELLTRLEGSSFWFQARNELINWALAESFPAAASLLEVGCGTGYVLASIAEAQPDLRLAGAELYLEGIHHAQERVPRADWYQLDATRIPFEAEWDVVCAFDVLEHVDDDESFLAGLHSAAVPGGGMILTVPQHPSLWSRADERAHHVRRYRRNELLDKVTAAGFTVSRVTSFVSLVLPLMWASRRRDRLSPHAYEAAREHSSWVGPALEWVCSVERWAIRRGLDFPAGGSLLVVAKRG